MVVLRLANAGKGLHRRASQPRHLIPCIEFSVEFSVWIFIGLKLTMKTAKLPFAVAIFISQQIIAIRHRDMFGFESPSR